MDHDGAANKRSGIGGSVNSGGRVLRQKFGDGGGLAVVVVFVGDNNSSDLAKEVGGELLGELYGVDKDGLFGFFYG